MKQWQQLTERFSGLTQRERGIIAVAGVAIIGMLGNLLLVEPALQQLERSRQSITTSQQTIQELELLIVEQQQKLAERPDSDVRSDIQRLQSALAGKQQQLQQATASLIPPEQMVPVLHGLLNGIGNLRLLRLTSLKPTILMRSGDDGQADGLANEASSEQAESNTASAPSSSSSQEQVGYALYEHGFQLELEGGYSEVKAFLEALEALPWQFRWQLLDYRVTSYPKAKVRLELFSMSTRRELIRV